MGISNFNLFLSNSCSHTNSRSGESWWQVDLGKVYDIEEILVYGRTDTNAQYTGSRVGYTVEPPNNTHLLTPLC